MGRARITSVGTDGGRPRPFPWTATDILAISTFKDGDRYLDACVRTRGKFEHAHGYYVARIKLQDQPGHWSAFWLYNSSVGKIGDEGRDGTEIDIMEKPWLDDRVQHALHWDGYGKEHKSEGKVATVPGVMEGWHTFALWWKADEYVFYVDGKETWRTDAGGVCQVPLYIKLSDEIGDWGWRHHQGEAAGSIPGGLRAGVRPGGCGVASEMSQCKLLVAFGYATPKVDVRGSVFRDDQILLVKERADGLWTLPGGWADVNESPREAVVREIMEESGYHTRANKLLAVWDRAKHQHTPLLLLAQFGAILRQPLGC